LTGRTLPSSPPPPALPAHSSAPAGPSPVAPGPSALLEWSALWTVYIVWGSTYLAIRVLVETVPPLLGGGARFLLAGAIMLGVLAVLRGPRAVRVSRSEALFAWLVGTLLMGANGLVSVAEKEVPSGVAALLIATVPLWVILYRRLAGEPITARSAGAVALGFVGVGILMLPGEQSAGASLLGLLTVVVAAAMWAAGSFTSPRVTLPRDLVVSTGWQMLLGGFSCVVAGLALGEASDVDFSAFSSDSVWAWVYLVVVGSLVAFTAYAWLLRNVNVSKVATYAYVNPVVAIFLGWLILDEVVTVVTVAGASVIVLSVALVIRTEGQRRR
jgi:drug/metabolite transporter (DMT)-like permease